MTWYLIDNRNRDILKAVQQKEKPSVEDHVQDPRSRQHMSFIPATRKQDK